MATVFAQSQLDAHAALAPSLPGAHLGWLAHARRAHLAAFARDDLPTTREERWKYTSLKALERRALAIDGGGAEVQGIPEDLLALPGATGPRLVFVDGRYDAGLSRLDGIDPAALVVQPLANALASGADGLCVLYTDPTHAARGSLDALNAAFAADGAVVRVAPGAAVAGAVHLVFVGRAGGGDRAWYARNRIDVQAGATLSVIEHHVDAGDHAHVGNLVTEVELAAGARLEWTRVSDTAPRATRLCATRFRLERDAALALNALELGGALVRNDVHVDLAGPQARLDARGTFALGGRQHAEQRLSIRHAARDTTCKVLSRGVADQRARGVFHGAIVMDAGADGADAQLSSKNLLLSPHAEIDTQPVLEINADEVKAAHGATVGQLDEQALFYLRTRGLAATQARTLLTLAFCREALDGVSDPALRAALSERLAAHLPSTGEVGP